MGVSLLKFLPLKHLLSLAHSPEQKCILLYRLCFDYWQRMTPEIRQLWVEMLIDKVDVLYADIPQGNTHMKLLILGACLPVLKVSDTS